MTDVLDASRPAAEGSSHMLAKRLLVVIILIPIVVALIATGGWPFYILVAAVLSMAGWEYARIFQLGGYSPSIVLVVVGIAGLVLERAIFGWAHQDVLLGALILLAMFYHLLAFEGGKEKSATDFAITLSGILYLGWLGSYLISLRNLPDGMWWMLVALPTIWLSDTGAYAIGSRFGHHPLAKRLSPKKTWEGYAAGVVFGTLGAGLSGLLWHLRSPLVTPGRALILGLVLSIITPLGDLGESMIKRQFGVKDSSNLLPGHGGVLDRIDSIMWAGIISYYLIILLWLK
ncbi:MAG TPA: phosphatidate cytidylyltransferase [Anaerolineaceae bacterium]|nr:phosphatidate cytidylyltransferase [Anaerolineaceae bacterium]